MSAAIGVMAARSSVAVAILSSRIALRESLLASMGSGVKKLLIELCKGLFMVAP